MTPRDGRDARAARAAIPTVRHPRFLRLHNRRGRRARLRYEQVEAGDLDAAVELNLRMWVDGPRRGPDGVDRGVCARVGEMQRRAFEVQLASEPGEHRRLAPPAVERLEEVAVPTLVVVGDADVADVLERAELLASRIPGARKVVLPDVAHMINLERPDAFLALVLDFLESLKPT